MVVNSWTIEEGLPANAVFGASADPRWLPVVACLNGLVRFDGVRFVPFHSWDGLTSLQTQNLLEDHSGRLWIGTEDAGIIMRESGHFHAFGRTNGLAGERVRALAEDGDGKIWVDTKQAWLVGNPAFARTLRRGKEDRSWTWRCHS